MASQQQEEFTIGELARIMKTFEPAGAWVDCIRQLEGRPYLLPKLLEMSQALLDEDRYHEPQLVTIAQGRERTPIGRYVGLSGHRLKVDAKIVDVRDGWYRLSLLFVPDYPAEGAAIERQVAMNSWTHFADGLELRHASGNDFLVRYQRQRPLYAPESL